MTKTLDGPDPIDVAVGARIRIQRGRARMSQTDLAHALGITFQQVQKYERGANRISASKLVAAAKALNTTVASLVGESEADPAPLRHLQALMVPGAAEVLEAYAAIGDGEARRALLTIITDLAIARPVRMPHPRLPGDYDTAPAQAAHP